MHVAVPVHFLAPRSQLILSCLPHTVPVPEEYQDFPGSVQRDLRHEEERAVRGLRPLRRQGFWKGKTALLGDTEGDGGSSPSLCSPAVPEDRTESAPVLASRGNCGAQSKLFISERPPLSWTWIFKMLMKLLGYSCSFCPLFFFCPVLSYFQPTLGLIFVRFILSAISVSVS